MKGVILAGGQATRLYPLTLVTNKHLLPVYHKPVIYYAIEKLVSAGIDRIMIVTSPHHLGGFVNLLGSGQNFKSKKNGKQIQIVYGIQNVPSGLADGLYIAKDYIGKDNCILHLGDNILEDDISKHVKTFKKGALVFLKEVSDPERFGVASVDKNGKVTEIVEKPLKPKTNLAVTGLYIYDNSVFKKMLGQKASKRGEFEITFVNNRYIKEQTLRSVLLKNAWFDVGTFDSLLAAGEYMKQKMKRPFAKKPGVIGLQTFDDSRDGCLYIGEATKNVPFEIKRFYCINNLPGKTAVRGKHAHKKLHQYIFCMNGSFTLELDNGTNKKRVVMDDPAHGISLGPLIWHTMSDFSKDCVILVVADDYYDESDYIRNYEDFIQQIKSTKH